MKEIKKLCFFAFLISMLGCANNNDLTADAAKLPSTARVDDNVPNNSNTQRLIFTVYLVREVEGKEGQILFLEDRNMRPFTALSTPGYNSNEHFKKGDKISLVPQKITKIGSGSKAFSMITTGDIKKIE